MKRIVIYAFTALFLTGPFFAPAAQAQQKKPVSVAAAAPGKTLTPVTSKDMPQYLDKELERKHAHFSEFAEVQVRKLNNNHRFSRSRMQITKLSDGSYKARFHSIDTETIVCQVRRSSSKIVPYVAVLKYQERIMESIGTSPKECRMGEFQPVTVIPTRQIYSYKKGTWQ